MILNIYAVHDKKALCYLNMFYRSHDGEALRSFADDIAEPKCPFAKHPEDYSLFKLGTVDTNSGEIIGCQVPKFISDALAFVAVDKAS